MHRLRRLPVLISLGLVAVLACTSGRAGSAGEATGPVVGLNCSHEQFSGPRKCGAIGTKIARVEFSVATTRASMGRFIRAYAARGIQIQPLAGFHGRLPSTAEAQNLRRWALRFGPRGAFWKGRSDGHLAIRNIEFGNETSYPYQYGESGRFWLLPSYAARARDYALRVKDAALALQGTGVGLLVQGEDGGSGSSAWIDHMFAAVPELSRYVAAWTVHPYGPGGYVKIDRMLSYLAGRGAPASTRFSITEWGLSSDNGRTLSNNYGYATNMTYDEAAATLREVIGLWRGAYGARVAQLLLYQHADQRAPGHSTDREHYFGVLKKDGSDKGTYTAEVRALIGASPAPSKVVVGPART